MALSTMSMWKAIGGGWKLSLTFLHASLGLSCPWYQVGVFFEGWWSICWHVMPANKPVKGVTFDHLVLWFYSTTNKTNNDFVPQHRGQGRWLNKNHYKCRHEKQWQIAIIISNYNILVEEFQCPACGSAGNPPSSTDFCWSVQIFLRQQHLIFLPRCPCPPPFSGCKLLGCLASTQTELPFVPKILRWVKVWSQLRSTIPCAWL